MNFNKFSLMRSAARVERMHTQPLARQQTVGEHTFNVLALIDMIAPEMTINLWRAALYHDIPEAITGDMPGNIKWKYEGLAKSLDQVEKGIITDYHLVVNLAEKEERVLKFCDTMELAIFCIEEAERGDRNAIRVAYNCIRFLEDSKLDAVTTKAEQLFTYVDIYLRNIFPNKGVLFNDRGE
jgi:5'-deoxynucleotidase YfbR-like HD superfamily hydrolase